MNKTDVYDAAKRSLACGISTIPPEQDGTKRPAYPWRPYQIKPPSADILAHWYAQGRTGVGWITGAVSRNLEIVDFDDRGAWREYRALAEKSGLGKLLDRIVDGYFEYSPNGAHLPYRCETIDGNTKLAKSASGKTLIETRGEGGYLIVAPTYGGVNANGAYTLQSGSIETIATITPDERKSLHDLARSMDASPPAREWKPQTTPDNWDTRPGDEYAQKTPWKDVLEPFDWVAVFERNGVTHWRRPGKRHGISATTNHGGSNLLYVFSTSTEFEAERGYNKFSAIALLKYNGDFTLAASELRLLGYGIEEATDPRIDLSGILAQAKKPETGFPPELLSVPGMIGDLAAWINKTSIKPQPILALGASIAAVATVIGRKVCTESDLRSNIYILGVAESGAGKERARQAIRKLFAACGSTDRARVDDLASDAAIVTEVQRSPACLFLIDEMGLFLKNVGDEKSGTHLKAVKSVFLRMYGATDGVFYGKSYADSERNLTIDQPCLSIYGTSIPRNFFDALTSAAVTEGLLSRFLVFESEDPDPLIQPVNRADKEPPADLVERFAAWEKVPCNVAPEGNLDAVLGCNPRVVAASTSAASVFADLESDTRKIRASARRSGQDPALYTRVLTTAQKLAIIRACGQSCEGPEVTEADAVWGSKLALYLTDRLWSGVKDYVADNETEARLKRVLGIIRKAGKISKGDLTRKTQHLKARERNEILTSLLESGQVAVRQTDDKRPVTQFRIIS